MILGLWRVFAAWRSHVLTERGMRLTDRAKGLLEAAKWWDRQAKGSDE